MPSYNNTQFWYDPAGGNAYDTPIEPAQRRRILSIVGTDDAAVPYQGGSGVIGYQFLDAEKSLYLLAKQMGYTDQLAENQGIQTINKFINIAILMKCCDG